MTLVDSVERHIQLAHEAGGRDQTTRITETNENVQRVHITPRIRDESHVSPTFSLADTPHSVTVAVNNSNSEEMEVEVQSSRNNDNDSQTSSDENGLYYLSFY